MKTKCVSGLIERKQKREGLEKWGAESPISPSQQQRSQAAGTAPSGLSTPNSAARFTQLFPFVSTFCEVGNKGVWEDKWVKLPQRRERSRDRACGSE